MPATKGQTPDTQEYKGEPLSDDLANGPMAKRSCTDPLCCLLFLAFIAGMIGVAAYALAHGNPNLIGRGYDSDGKMCGIDAGYENYPYLFFPLPGVMQKYRVNTVCVETCPDSAAATLNCHTNAAYGACTVVNMEGYANENQIAAGLAAGSASTSDFFIYTTVGFLKRWCVPKTTAFNDAAKSLFNTQIIEEWISDIRTCWPIILGSMGVAFLIGFVYMVLLRYCSGVLTWLAILCFIAGTAVLGWRFYQNAKDLENSTENTGTDNSDSSNGKTVITQKAIAYALWAVAGITVIGVLCMWNRIRLAIAILKSAADYVKDTPTIFLVPIFTIVILVCLFGYWGLTAVYLVSSGDATQIKGYPVGDFEYDDKLKKLLVYHLFGLLWFNAFIIASTQFIMASSACLWYFSQGTGQKAEKTVSKSVYRLFRYHFGSIAFGSLILAIVQMIRIILAYIQAQAKKMAGKEGKFVQYVLTCLQCYVACFERFIKFLNKNAYIQIALTGKNFCFAAKDAFFLILRNPLRFSIVGGIGAVFVLFGKMFVAAITALIGFIVITKWSYFGDQLYSPFFPVVCIFIFAYVIGACFMTVYGMAADAILACFIVDEELQKKKNSPPLHCPEALRDFLHKNKKN